jgi:hypothetical protein
MEAAECRVTLPRDLGLRFFEGPFDAGGANVLPHVFPHIHAHVAAAFECIEAVEAFRHNHFIVESDG